MSRDSESRAGQIRQGLLDPADLARRAHAARPIADHLGAYAANLQAKNVTPAYAALTLQQTRRLVETLGAGWLRDLTNESVQRALGALRDQGSSLRTLNHYRTSVKSFTKWLVQSGRPSTRWRA